MHAYLGIFLLFGLAYLFFSFKKQKLMLLALGCGAVLIALCFICSSGKVDKLKFIKSTELDAIEIPNTGVFYLASGSNAWLGNSFIMSDTQTVESLTDFVKSANDNVYLYIKDGDTLNYSSNLGMFLTEEDAERIMKTYTSWKESGTMPNEKIRYDFLCFYVEY